MKRTISAEVGKGSINHNSRKFKAANVDPTRTHLNINYCNEPIEQVYHELFDKALERYNARQTRADRQIRDYYEKVRSGKQEKPFHELVIQIGNKDDTGSATEIGEQAKIALDAFFQSFQERNPNLHVFAAHLHMDESTPHIHIDFVPLTTGSKRGLDTRVSLKQALAAQGFRGGSRGATEWNQWVQSEKEQLAKVMERYGFEWEQKGTHEQHLSVIDYKKQERSKELAAVEEQLAEKKQEFSTLAKRVNNLEDADHDYYDMERKLAHEPEYQLPLTFTAEAAIYVVGRSSGEGNDRLNEKGDYRLTDTEVRDILALNNGYKHFMLVINAGGPVDYSGKYSAAARLMILLHKPKKHSRLNTSSGRRVVAGRDKEPAGEAPNETPPFRLSYSSFSTVLS